MLKTKLFRILKSMDLAELKRFQSFARSPYHNTNKTISRLLDYFEKYFQTIGKKSEGKRFDKEAIFQNVYNNSEFKEGTFVVLRSQTLSLLEDFFVIERFKTEKKLKQKFLAESYENRNVLRVYQNNYVKYEQINLKEEIYSSKRIAHRLEILTTKMDWPHFSKIKEGLPLISEVSDELDAYYLHKKMMLETIKTNLYQEIKKPVVSHFYEDTFAKQLTKHKTKNVVIELYSEIRKMLIVKVFDRIAIEKIRKRFELASPNLEFVDREIIYFNLQNLVIRERSSKGSRLSTTLFDTYLTGLETKIIGGRNQIYYRTFYNIVTAGGEAKRFKEVGNFIKEYSDKIYADDRESTLKLAKARMMYDRREKKSWQGIIELLSDFNHSDIILRVKGRSLLVRAFFMIFQEDRTYDTLALAKIRSFKAFLSREKSTLKGFGRKEQRLAFWLQRLILAQIEKKSNDYIAHIFKQIEEDIKTSVFFKEWLLKLKTDANFLNRKEFR